VGSSLLSQQNLLQTMPQVHLLIAAVPVLQLGIVAGGTGRKGTPQKRCDRLDNIACLQGNVLDS